MSQNGDNSSRKASVESKAPTDVERASPTGEKPAPATEAKPAAPPALPGPFDEGWQPWIQVVGTFAVWTNSWGLFNSFGEFQTYYQQELLANKSPDDIAWIGSLQAFLLLFLGVVSGPLYDAGYFRMLLIVGNFLVVFGMMMTSLCHEYWQFILAQGLVVGAGYGLIFTPIVSLLPQWFQKRKALATGLAASGSGIGGIIYPIVFRNLEPTIGFGWATRVIGFLALFLGLISITCCKSKIPKAPKIRTLFDPRDFRDLPYTLYNIGGFLVFTPIYAPFFYIGAYALDHQITSRDLAAYLVVFINVGSVLGRILLSPLADRFGLMNIGALSIACSGVLALAWIGIHNVGGLVVFAVLYGVFAGTYLGIASLLVVPLTADLRKLGTRIGQISVTASVAALIGTPISGAILEGTGSFLGIQVFTGVLMLVGAGFVVWSKSAKFGWDLASIH